MSIPPLLTIAELRAYVRAEEDPAQDAMLLAMAAAAERHIEALTGQVLTRRTEVVRDTRWPDAGWEFIRHPLIQVLEIAYIDADGEPAVLPGSVWVLEVGTRSLVRLRESQRWPEILPDSEITITLDVGYPDEACPPQLRLGCLMLAGHWFDNRGAASVGVSVAELPLTVSTLVSPFRLKRIG